MSKSKQEYRILTFKHLENILYPHTPQAGTKSVLSPSAQSDTLCGERGDLVKLSKLVERLIAKNSQLPVLLKAIIELLFLNGLRISEVLQIKGTDISNIGNIRIKGSKGSADRWVVTGIYREYWKSRRHVTSPIGDIYNRFYLYREFKKLGISLEKGHGKNKAITHAFRHLVITDNLTTTDEIESTKNFIGHKTSKSTQYYDRREKKNRTTE